MNPIGEESGDTSTKGTGSCNEGGKAQRARKLPSESAGGKAQEAGRSEESSPGKEAWERPCPSREETAKAQLEKPMEKDKLQAGECEAERLSLREVESAGMCSAFKYFVVFWTSGGEI